MSCDCIEALYLGQHYGITYDILINKTYDGLRYDAIIKNKKDIIIRFEIGMYSCDDFTLLFNGKAFDTVKRGVHDEQPLVDALIFWAKELGPLAKELGEMRRVEAKRKREEEASDVGQSCARLIEVRNQASQNV